MTSLRFRAIDEPRPGLRLGAEFARLWPAYQSRLLDNDGLTPDYRTCRAMLGRHMPELVPVYDQLLCCLGANEEQARFLSLWCPPTFIHGCTQAVWLRQPCALVRNYDYAPSLCEALLLRSTWLSRIVAMADCLWGTLDGMNAAGLVISLTFGGRRAKGPGFGVTLILRYILETCRTVAEGLAVLRRVPVHLAYNIALLDRHHDWCTVAIAPDRPPETRREAYSANRQGLHAWPDDLRLADTVRREAVLAAYLDNPAQTADSLVQRFLDRPLHRPVSEGGWGTLYTAAYRPAEGTMELCWPHQRWRQSLAAFTEGERVAYYA
ncbi:MAG: C45 family peptidase [Rhodospirillales bacterium]